MSAPQEEALARAAEMFRLLGDPTRLRVMLACLEGPAPVGAIAEAAGASPSLTSHHLRLLRAAGLARGRRRSRQVLYEAADAHVRRMLDELLAHAAHPHEEGSQTEI
ncbi:ArsR/SmtB family transcription factor [Neomegalonema perideroedes]|uniref:ArsR/SmtB family transcription factor n=1 Tax=Neomegalonema perideroedes TaxID=217219 RepID=UPI000376FB90|nr:metalloregulator ArsR/SmtB family transcription factor [Neomegalonema perideroedes]